MSKNKSCKGRQTQLEHLKNLYAKQREGQENNMFKIDKKDSAPIARNERVLANAYVGKDLRNLLILTLLLAIFAMAVYFYELKTSFLEPLANNLLNGIIK